jgi:outer membrane protein assembly factor BamB
MSDIFFYRMIYKRLRCRSGEGVLTGKKRGKIEAEPSAIPISLHFINQLTNNHFSYLLTSLFGMTRQPLKKEVNMHPFKVFLPMFLFASGGFTVALPVDLTFKWKFKDTMMESCTRGPLVFNGSIYFGTDDRFAHPYTEKRVYCIVDKEDSAGITWKSYWDSTITNMNWLCFPIARATAGSGVVFCCNDDCKLHAYNATNGDSIPDFPIINGCGCVTGQVALYGSFLYFGSEEGYPINESTNYPGTIFCHNAATADPLWYWCVDSVASNVEIKSWISVTDTLLYFATTSEGYLYALYTDPDIDDTLRLKWKWRPSGTGNFDVASGPLLSDGKLFYGSITGIFYAVYENPPDGPGGTDTLAWKYPLNSNLGQIWAHPCIWDTLVYFGTEQTTNGKVYALRKSNGSAKWIYPMMGSGEGGFCWSTPIVTAGVLYIGNDNGKLYALNALTGTLIGTYQVPDPDELHMKRVASPSISADGKTVYVPAWNDTIYAIKAVNTSGDIITSLDKPTEYASGNGLESGKNQSLRRSIPIFPKLSIMQLSIESSSFCLTSEYMNLLVSNLKDAYYGERVLK